jgi:ElaB/YqjD/DUF883 family membrane-anchored ribosome-binding protein
MFWHVYPRGDDNMLETTQTAQAAKPKETTQHSAAEQQSSDAPGLTASADIALQSVGSLYTALDTAVSKHVRDNPYATLAAAAGVGFILGGGMRSPVGQLLMRVGVRAFGPPLVSAALHNAVERAQALTQPQT